MTLVGEKVVTESILHFRGYKSNAVEYEVYVLDQYYRFYYFKGIKYMSNDERRVSLAFYMIP